MKKRYIIPTISFEIIEEESLLIGESRTYIQDLTTPGGDISQNTPGIGGELTGDITPGSGGIFVDDGEGDD